HIALPLHDALPIYLMFRWVCRINPGKASECVTLFSDRSAQMISCVLLSTARCSLRQIRRRSWPCFLTFHSPSPKTFSPVESITRCAISPRVGVLKLTLTDFARLLTQL